MAVFVPDSYEVDGLRRLRSALLDSHSAVVWNRTVVEEPCVNRRIGLSPFRAAPLAHLLPQNTTKCRDATPLSV